MGYSGIYGDDPDFLLAYYKLLKFEAEYSYDGNSLKNKYELGGEILNKYASVSVLLDFGINMLKDCIEYQQKNPDLDSSKGCKGYPEKYAAEIKKYDSSYEMPKKRGCVSVGKA